MECCGAGRMTRRERGVVRMSRIAPVWAAVSAGQTARRHQETIGRSCNSPGGDRGYVRQRAEMADERADAVGDLGIDDVLHAARRVFDFGIRKMHRR
jgi:hypothetical protein